MKRMFFVLVFISSIVWSQEIKVQSRNEVLDLSGNEFFFPVLNNDASKLLLTKSNYQGLYLFELSTKKLTTVSEELGSGYKPAFSEDGNKIVYKVDKYDGIKRFSDLMEYEISSGVTTELISNERFMNLVKSDDGKFLTVLTEKNKRAYNISNFNLSEQNSQIRFVFTDSEKIIFSTNGVQSEYQPMGEGNYVWVSSSLDNKILFHFAGNGTFVNDLNNNSMYEIGYANAPVFTADGKYVIYMNDKDNGEKVISSDILVSSFDGTKTFNLTESEDILEMYPQISGNGKVIACNTDDGRIFLIEVSFEWG